MVKRLGNTHNLVVVLRRSPDDHLGALAGGHELWGTLVDHKLVLVRRDPVLDLPHGL